MTDANDFTPVAAGTTYAQALSFFDNADIVIRFGEHIKTIAVDDIAYCFSENKATFARTFENRTYPMDFNLDALESMLDPQDFFRINRQYIISLKSINEMKTYSKARVIITLKPPVKEQPVVSSERSAHFKLWLAGEL